MECVFLPTTLFLNWHIVARRRPLITGAISLLHEPRLDLCLLYSRNLPADGTAPESPLSADLASQIAHWVNLSWIRCAVDGALALVLLFAALRPQPER
jgi:hypothetical protein